MQLVRIFSLVIAISLAPPWQTAEAYIGPGAGISAIGTVVALVAAILLAIVGFVWYPIKRLRAKRLQAKSQQAESTDDASPTS